MSSYILLMCTSSTLHFQSASSPTSRTCLREPDLLSSGRSWKGTSVCWAEAHAPRVHPVLYSNIMATGPARRTVLSLSASKSACAKWSTVASAAGFDRTVCHTGAAALEAVDAAEIAVVVCALGRGADSCWPVLARIRHSQVFGVVFSNTVCTLRSIYN